MTTAPIHFEPTDPPEMPTIPVDRDDFDRITACYHLPIERSADEQRVYVTVDGLTFWAPSVDVAVAS